MDLQKLSIGQMAELNHVSEQTLRLYDKEGLLRPPLRRSRHGATAIITSPSLQSSTSSRT